MTEHELEVCIVLPPEPRNNVLEVYQSKYEDLELQKEPFYEIICLFCPDWITGKLRTC